MTQSTDAAAVRILREMLSLAVNQGEHDMLLTGDELRAMRNVLERTAGLTRAPTTEASAEPAAGLHWLRNVFQGEPPAPHATWIEWVNEVDRSRLISGVTVRQVCAEDYAHGQASAATQPAGEALYLIMYDEHDKRPVIVQGEQAARATFARIGAQGFNAHLFGKLESNSRDDPTYSFNLAAPISEDTGKDAKFSQLERAYATVVEQCRELALAARTPAAPVADADTVRFNARRLRNVLELVGLTDPFPDSDAQIADCMGTLLGQVAGVLRERAAADAEPEAENIGEELANFLGEHTRLGQDGIDNHAMKMVLALNYAAIKPVSELEIASWYEDGYLEPAPVVDLHAAIPAACYRVDWTSNEPAAAMLMAAMKEEIADLRAALARHAAAELVASHAPAGLIPRRPWDDDVPDGMLESDRDFVENNFALVLAFLEGEVVASHAPSRFGSPELQAMIVARASHAPSVPDGFVLVPIEPTEAMLAEICRVKLSPSRVIYRAILAADGDFRAWLAAAPTPPKESDNG